MDGSCIGKEKVADSKISGYEWTDGTLVSCFLAISKKNEQLVRILWGLFVGFFGIHNESSYFPFSFKSISDSVTLLSCYRGENNFSKFKIAFFNLFEKSI